MERGTNMAYINTEINKDLKFAIIVAGMNQAQVAEWLGINRQIFNRKINHTTTNGFHHSFTADEKQKLKGRFNVDVE